MDNVNWSHLPEHIIVEILSYLDLPDRYRASLICRPWNSGFTSRYLWTKFHFNFFTAEHGKYLKCVKLYGRYFKEVTVRVDQKDPWNRTNGCQVLLGLCSLEEYRLERLTIKFTSQNPCMYSGREYLDALYKLVECHTKLQRLDLSGLHINFDGRLCDILSENNPDLQVLNVQNRVLVCKVLPEHLLQVVQRCRKLTDLLIFNCSLSEEVLIALCDIDRRRLRHLSIICRREEKYAKNIDSMVWKKLRESNRGLEVTLKFDHTCPLYRVSQLMDPEIPVVELYLETFTDLANEIQLASNYENTLRILLVVTAGSSDDLDAALLHLATQCHKLSELHVQGCNRLRKETVDKILALLPALEDNRRYTLKYNGQPTTD